MDAALRVLFTLATLDGGGAERTVLTLVPHLQARGLDARVGLLAPVGPRDGGIDPARVVLARRGPSWMNYAPSPGLGRVVAGVPLVPLQQLDLLRQFRPGESVSGTLT